jgi:hypothetical protein
VRRTTTFRFLHSLTVRRASSPSCSLRALLTILVRVDFNSTRVCHPFCRVAQQKKKKTWLGLKGDQCEQTFYNGGWSQAQLSYGAPSSYSGRRRPFQSHRIRTSEHFIQSAFWRWLRNFTSVTFPDLPSKFLHALFEPRTGALMLCSSARVSYGLAPAPL